MHFCELAARLSLDMAVPSWQRPRKSGLNWFMPALMKSSVGSSCGTTGDEGQRVCAAFFSKKSTKVSRIWATVVNCEPIACAARSAVGCVGWQRLDGLAVQGLAHTR